MAYKKVVRKVRKKMTEAQLNFCEEYLANGGNGTDAYMRAYGMQDKKKASVSSAGLLKKTYIKKYIEKQQSMLRVRHDISKDEIVADLIKVKNEALAEGDRLSVIRVAERLCKMFGYDAAQKLDINTDVDKLKTGEIELLKNRFKNIGLSPEQ